MKRVTLKHLLKLKADRIPASFVTAYDYPTAHFADAAGIDMLLVGDSAGMTMLGYENTIPVTMEEMLIFARAVCRARKSSFVVGDMPFLSYQVNDSEAVRNAGAFLRAGCDAVKLEGGNMMACDRIRALTSAGIPVMAHLGMTPQSVNLTGYKIAGKTKFDADRVLYEAQSVENAGAQMLLLEGMPEEPASRVREALGIPVYGIGAGAKLDGQLLIFHDLVGYFVGKIKPKFAKQYVNMGEQVQLALMQYHAEVKEGKFPSAEYTYAPAPQEVPSEAI